MDSTDLSGDHVIGSQVTTGESGDAAELGFIIAAGGIGAWLASLVPGYIALIAAGLGVVVFFATDQSTVIQLSTENGSEEIEIPDDAEHLGQAVSKVIAS